MKNKEKGTRLRIIMIEDNPADAELLEIMLSDMFGDPICINLDNETDLRKELINFHPDLVISDYSMPGFSGSEALRICSELVPEVPFIFVSGTIGEERAVEALKNGAVDYVLKSSMVRLPHAAQTAIKIARERIEKQKRENQIKRLSMVASQIDNGVWIGNSKMETLWINPAFSMQFGYSLEELQGRPQSEFFIKMNSLEPLNEIMYGKLVAGESIHEELELERCDQSSFWASVHITPVMNEENSLEQVIAITSDITQRKKAELQRDELLQTLEQKVKERTRELQDALSQLQKKNKSITDSINYARYIQEAFITEIVPKDIKVNDAFTVNLPKDVLSGDFHWHYFDKINNSSYVALGDCTGHGVPASLMTMLAVQYLEQQIIGVMNPKEPDKILHDIDRAIINFLDQTNSANMVNDGMEIALVKIDHRAQEITYSGAGRSLYFFSTKGLNRFLAPRYSVGGLIEGFDKSFVRNTFKFEKGERIYMFSDGYADQFGGKYGKKYSRRRKEDYLVSIQSEPFTKHQQLLHEEFSNWKGKRSQIDDVMVLGIEL